MIIFLYYIGIAVVHEYIQGKCQNGEFNIIYRGMQDLLISFLVKVRAKGSAHTHAHIYMSIYIYIYLQKIPVQMISTVSD